MSEEDSSKIRVVVRARNRAGKKHHIKLCPSQPLDAILRSVSEKVGFQVSQLIVNIYQNRQIVEDVQLSEPKMLQNNDVLVAEEAETIATPAASSVRGPPLEAMTIVTPSRQTVGTSDASHPRAVTPVADSPKYQIGTVVRRHFGRLGRHSGEILAIDAGRKEYKVRYHNVHNGEDRIEIIRFDDRLIDARVRMGQSSLSPVETSKKRAKATDGQASASCSVSKETDSSDSDYKEAITNEPSLTASQRCKLKGRKIDFKELKKFMIKHLRPSTAEKYISKLRKWEIKGGTSPKGFVLRPAESDLSQNFSQLRDEHLTSGARDCYLHCCLRWLSLYQCYYYRNVFPRKGMPTDARSGDTAVPKRQRSLYHVGIQVRTWRNKNEGFLDGEISAVNNKSKTCAVRFANGEECHLRFGSRKLDSMIAEAAAMKASIVRQSCTNKARKRPPRTTPSGTSSVAIGCEECPIEIDLDSEDDDEMDQSPNDMAGLSDDQRNELERVKIDLFRFQDFMFKEEKLEKSTVTKFLDVAAKLMRGDGYRHRNSQFVLCGNVDVRMGHDFDLLMDEAISYGEKCNERPSTLMGAIDKLKKYQIYFYHNKLHVPPMNVQSS